MMRVVMAALAVSLAMPAALSGAAGPDFAAMSIQPYAPPKAAPPLTLPAIGGKPWSLAEARGKVVLLFFWTTW